MSLEYFKGSQGSIPTRSISGGDAGAAAPSPAPGMATTTPCPAGIPAEPTASSSSPSGCAKLYFTCSPGTLLKGEFQGRELLQVPNTTTPNLLFRSQADERHPAQLE